MRLVLDNVAAMWWLLSDRLFDVQGFALAAVQRFANGDTALVPNSFALEAAHVLLEWQERGLASGANPRKVVAW